MFQASITRTALLGMALLVGGTSIAAASESLPPGNKYRDCHGYVRHVDRVYIRVHCIDGVPADLVFVTFPTYANRSNGRSIRVQDLAPDTRVHVIYTQSLGVRHAYKIFVADPNGRGLYGFKS